MKMSAIVQSILSPLRATPPPNAGAYQKQHTANDRASADPSGNRAPLIGGNLQLADSDDAPLGTVAVASDHNDGAKHGQ